MGEYNKTKQEKKTLVTREVTVYGFHYIVTFTIPLHIPYVFSDMHPVSHINLCFVKPDAVLEHKSTH
jgi:hypothetical protein